MKMIFSLTILMLTSSQLMAQQPQTDISCPPALEIQQRIQQNTTYIATEQNKLSELLRNLQSGALSNEDARSTVLASSIRLNQMLSEANLLQGCTTKRLLELLQQYVATHP